jgi:hypothetical protein
LKNSIVFPRSFTGRLTKICFATLLIDMLPVINY